MNAKLRLPVLTLLVLILGVRVALPSPARPKSMEQPLPTSEILARIQAKAKVLKNLRAYFQQRKSTPLLLMPMESEGYLYWQAPDRLRWVVSRPAPFVLVARGDTILLVYPDLNRATLYRYPLGGGLLGKIAGATADPEALQRQYRIHAALVPGVDNTSRINLTLEPKSGRRARHLKRVEVMIDPETWLPQEITILESDKDKTAISLSHIRENTNLSEDLFSVEAPDGIPLERFEGRGRP